MKDWRQEEMGKTEDKLVGWHHRLCTWVWASSGRQWRTGKPGVMQSMGLRRVRHNLGTKQQQRLSYDLKQQQNHYFWKPKKKFCFANLNDFENWHKRDTGDSRVIYKEDLLKKISSCRNRIDNVTNTHFDLNLTSSHIFKIPVTSSYYSDDTLQLHLIPR